MCTDLEILNLESITFKRLKIRFSLSDIATYFKYAVIVQTTNSEHVVGDKNELPHCGTCG
jgi:hypothetical protein